MAKEQESLEELKRVQVWPLYDQPEHVIEGAASLRCWCEPELETCEGSLLIKHRDRRARLLAGVPDLRQYTEDEYAQLCSEGECPISARQAMALRRTLTDPTGFQMRVEYHD